MAGLRVFSARRWRRAIWLGSLVGLSGALWAAPALAWAAPLAALLWGLGFVLFLVVHAPMLLRPRIDGKPG